MGCEGWQTTICGLNWRKCTAIYIWWVPFPVTFTHNTTYFLVKLATKHKFMHQTSLRSFCLFRLFCQKILFLKTWSPSPSAGHQSVPQVTEPSVNMSGNVFNFSGLGKHSNNKCPTAAGGGLRGVSEGFGWSFLGSGEMETGCFLMFFAIFVRTWVVLAGAWLHGFLRVSLKCCLFWKVISSFSGRYKYFLSINLFDNIEVWRPTKWMKTKAKWCWENCLEWWLFKCWEQTKHLRTPFFVTSWQIFQVWPLIRWGETRRAA